MEQDEKTEKEAEKRLVENRWAKLVNKVRMS